MNKRFFAMPLYLLPLIQLTILTAGQGSANEAATKTPIKHLVVIFQENRSFDHYFGTYPYAQNNPGEIAFTPRKDTPMVNGLPHSLLIHNENKAEPYRLSPRDAITNISDPGHEYAVLQASCHGGLMDKFVETSGASCSPPELVMGHFDGNTVTALWNYAQHFSMSDNYHSSVMAPSTAGCINLISGQTHGALPPDLVKGRDKQITIQGTVINDADPKFDKCSAGDTVEMTGRNVGDLLNKKGISWGWFQGGFRDCKAKHIGPRGKEFVDYIPHHNPFQYYKSTSNPEHLPPESVEKIGQMDQANHIYDLADFWAAAEAGNVPSICYLRAPAYQDGHPGHSHPLLEQEFLVNTLNRLQELPQWENMAVIIAWDDSGGWYDHAMPPIFNQSGTKEDPLVSTEEAGKKALGGYQGRLGYGMRLPFVLISPWAKENYVDHTLIDQASILQFVEDNWLLDRIGNFSFDLYAGSIFPMFDFDKPPRKERLMLIPQTGEIRRSNSL